MRNLLTVSILLSVTFLYTLTETASQAIAPIGYGSSPILYNQSDDDNLGMLLTILMLAGKGRNQNGGCGQSCNCCNCCCGDCAQNVPIPFPIPIPTNNAIVTRPYYNSLDDYDDDDEETTDDKGVPRKGNGSNGQKKGSQADSGYEAGEIEIEEEDESVEEAPDVIVKPNS